MPGHSNKAWRRAVEMHLVLVQKDCSRWLHQVLQLSCHMPPCVVEFHLSHARGYAICLLIFELCHQLTVAAGMQTGSYNLLHFISAICVALCSLSVFRLHLTDTLCCPSCLLMVCWLKRLIALVQVLHAEGAREVYACATHAVLSPPATARLSSGVFQEVIIANTIPVKAEDHFPELTVLSVANLLGETIWRVYNASSVQSIL